MNYLFFGSLVLIVLFIGGKNLETGRARPFWFFVWLAGWDDQIRVVGRFGRRQVIRLHNFWERFWRFHLPRYLSLWFNAAEKKFIAGYLKIKDNLRGKFKFGKNPKTSGYLKEITKVKERRPDSPEQTESF